jgi:hypothetical protein
MKKIALPLLCCTCILFPIHNLPTCTAFSNVHVHSNSKSHNVNSVPLMEEQKSKNPNVDVVHVPHLQVHLPSFLLPAAAAAAACLIIAHPLPASAADDFFSRAAAAQQYYQSPSSRSRSTSRSPLTPETDPRKAKAMKQLIEEQTRQDARLDQCIDRGQDWEQCFMFGDSSSSTFADGMGNDWPNQLGIGIGVGKNKMIPLFNLEKARGPELPVPGPGSLLGGGGEGEGDMPRSNRKPPTW